MIGKYYLNITICCLVFVTVAEAMGGPGYMGKGRKCRVQFKFPKPCIDLKPPEDVNTAIKKCWNEAIDTDFKCQKIDDFMKERFTKKNAMKKKPMSPADFIFISSFHWLVYFTDDIAPNLCPLIKAQTREKIKSSFRNCFLKETNLEMGEIINVRQVISQIEKYSGPISNITTVVGIADVCSSKANNQEDFSKCVHGNLLGACMRDPYYKKPFDHKHRRGGYKPGNGKPDMDDDSSSEESSEEEDTGPRPGPNGKYTRKGGNPMGRPHGKGCHGPGHRKKFSCEPCYPLASSDEMRTAWKSCLDSVKPADFYTKFMRCIKWEPKEDKPKKSMWIQLFTPRIELSVFFNRKSHDANLDCMYQKLGLGSTTDVNPAGFKDLVLNHLEGDEKVKDQVIETIDACAYTNQGVKITSDDFTQCTADRLQKECDEDEE